MGATAVVNATVAERPGSTRSRTRRATIGIEHGADATGQLHAVVERARRVNGSAAAEEARAIGLAGHLADSFRPPDATTCTHHGHVSPAARERRLASSAAAGTHSVSTNSF